MIATLFYNPLHISHGVVLWLIIPLCLSVAVIYKTVRTDNLRRLPMEILVLMGYMTGGLVALGGALVLMQYLFLR